MLHKIIFLALIFASTTVFAQETIDDVNSTKDATALISNNSSTNNEEIISDDIIIVAPNPSASLLYITSKILPESIELYDANGKFIEKSSSNKYVNFGSLNQGNYLLKLHYTNFTAVKKVIKK